MSIATTLLESLPHISDDEFVLLRGLIHSLSGIHLNGQKQVLVRTRLWKRLRACGFKTFREYYAYLTQQDESGEERVQMLNAICTNLTEFFRGEAHFDHLKERLIHEWRHEPQIRVLSAGCSTGEEAYSIAICAQEVLGADAGRRMWIDAGDLSTQVLRQAQAGIYSAEKIRGISPQRLSASFLRGAGNCEGLYSVQPHLRQMIEFRRLNLMEPLPYTLKFHAIFFRNVAIYFDRQTQLRIHQQLHAALVPGGTLFVGHTESLLDMHDLFSYIGPSMYRRR